MKKWLNAFVREHGINDLLKALVIEILWVLTGIGLTGILTEYWLEPLVGGFIVILPASIFALLSLLLTAYLNPRWYFILFMCVIGLAISPALQYALPEGFFAWEMTYTGGPLDWGLVVQFFFWNGTFVLQTVASLLGGWLRNRRNAH